MVNNIKLDIRFKCGLGYGRPSPPLPHTISYYSSILPSPSDYHIYFYDILVLFVVILNVFQVIVY